MSPIPFKKKQYKIEVGSETGIEEEKDYKFVDGIEHDRYIMLQELKKYFKPKFYNKVCEFRWEEIRRLFGILKGR
tara:strand:- start:483 stop:707 length:225 start_codon:yes stop_codon:yes gene_type:complete